MEVILSEGVMCSGLDRIGRPDTYVYLSSFSNPELDSFFNHWINSKEDISLKLNIKISDLMDDVIEGSRINEENVITKETKPLIDAIRAQMVAEIARIDALKYTE